MEFVVAEKVKQRHLWMKQGSETMGSLTLFKVLWEIALQTFFQKRLKVQRSYEALANVALFSISS